MNLESAQPSSPGFNGVTPAPAPSPAPVDEFRLVAVARLLDIDLAVAAGEAQRVPLLLLAAIAAAPVAAHPLVGHLVAQPLPRAAEDAHVRGLEAGLLPGDRHELHRVPEGVAAHDARRLEDGRQEHVVLGGEVDHAQDVVAEVVEVGPQRVGDLDQLQQLDHAGLGGRARHALRPLEQIHHPVAAPGRAPDVAAAHPRQARVREEPRIILGQWRRRGQRPAEFRLAHHHPHQQ